MDNLKSILQAKTEEQKNPLKEKGKRGPRTPHQLLALEMAESFGKSGSRRDIAVLMNLCKKYDDQYLRRVWGIVKEKNISNKMPYFLAVVKNMNEEEKKERFKNLNILFIGTSSFAVPALKELKNNNLNILAVITQPDRPAGRKKELSPSPIKIEAEKYGLRVLQPEKISEIADEIKMLNPHLTVMVSYGQIIPQEIIDIPKYGTINIHPSLLPKYRGPSPIQAAILNEDQQTGITIMLVDGKMDHGPIIASKKIKIETKDYPKLHDELSIIGAKLLIEIIPGYIGGNITAKEQDDNKATYTKIITKEDGKINWLKNAKKIAAQIKALRPWPGTWCNMNESKKIKIISASVLEEKSKNRDYGKLFLTPEKKPGVLCGTGSLILERVQPEGKAEMDGAEFFRGYNTEKFI